MKRSRIVWWTVSLLLVVHWSHAWAGPWKAGAAKVRITPEQPMWMAGYAARNHPAEGKLTELWAKALALEDGQENRGLIVTLDVVGIDRQLAAEICGQLEQHYALRRDQVALCCSHTHSGPVVGYNLAPMHYLMLDDQQKALVDEYAKTLVKRVVEVSGRAIQAMAPADLAWGSGRATFATNRRNNPAGEVPARRRTGKLVGPTDHDVPVLSVRDDEGQLKAVLFGYACHATVLSDYQWCGDYPGYAQEQLETNHPGCVALFWAGCGADQNPLPRRSVELARHYGQHLATSVDAVLLTTEMRPIEGSLRTAYQEIPLTLSPMPTHDDLVKQAASKDRYHASRAKWLLQQWESKGKLDSTYPYPIAVWHLGDDVQFVILGGEVVVDFALRLKQELRGQATWVAGYANDVMAYIPSRRVLREGGYEGATAMVYYGLPTTWAPDVEQAIVEEVHRQLYQPVEESQPAGVQ